MNSQFPDWYHAARVEVDSAELNRRWEGIEAFDKSLEIDKALDALRLFNGIPPRDTNFKEEFGSVFQQIDPTFRIRNNDLELRILAGASIVKALERRNDELSDPIALSTICASTRGLFSNGMNMNQDVLDAALNYLIKRAVQVRSPDAFTFKPTSIAKLNKAVETLAGSFTNTTTDAFKTTVADPFNLIHTATANQGALINKLFYALKIQREESNILWWLVGDHSRDLEKPISEFKVGAVVIAGKELADLTSMAPGPRSAPAILDRMLKQGNLKLPATVTIKDAVNSAPEDWREKLMAETKMQRVQDFCSVHSAMQKSIQTSGSTDWTRAFNKIGLVKATQQIAPLDLALQVYQEATLIRFFGGE
jgi:hypothetical protein